MVAEKVTVAERAVPEHGLGAVLSALDLARSTWYYQQKRQSYAQRHAALRAPLERIARKHPEYGYRRATAETQEELVLVVQKRLRYYNRVRRHSSLGMISPLEFVASLDPHPEG
jgi:transposase InsO family protein